jgi:hypothetical protein
MKTWQENYGADIDGNRGVPAIFYELEAGDKDKIIEKLYEIQGNTTGMQVIEMYCYLVDEDIEIEVNVEDYIDGLIIKADADEEIKDNEDLQQWLKELKEVQNG